MTTINESTSVRNDKEGKIYGQGTEQKKRVVAKQRVNQLLHFGFVQGQ